MKTARVLLLVAAFVASLLPASARGDAPEREADKSENVKLLAHFPYKNEEGDFRAGGTDLDFQGRYVYAMQQGNEGGVHVIDHKGKKPRKIAFIPCPGTQNDVAVVKPGLIALGYHSSTCGSPGAGVRLLDVKNPKRPKLLGAVNDIPGGTHTLTVYPGKAIIYSSPNRLGNVRGIEHIIDVSNPRDPKVVGEFQPPGSTCHDLTFHISKEQKLAFCPGTSGTDILDVSEPTAPELITRIVNPLLQYHHSAVATHDGKYLVIGDEAVAGNDCVGGPTGAQFIYDISDPSIPILMGYFGTTHAPLPIGSPDVDDNTWCSSHLFNFIPGTYILVSSWYAGGMTVVDWSDPSSPQEIAYYLGTGEDITNYWSAYWHDGRIYANDRVKGLDVFEVKGLKEKK